MLLLTLLRLPGRQRAANLKDPLGLWFELERHGREGGRKEGRKERAPVKIRLAVETQKKTFYFVTLSQTTGATQTIKQFVNYHME